MRIWIELAIWNVNRILKNYKSKKFNTSDALLDMKCSFIQVLQKTHNLSFFLSIRPMNIHTSRLFKVGMQWKSTLYVY